MIWHSAEKQAVLNFLSSNENTGLTTERAVEIYKENKYEIEKAKPSFIKIFLSQFTDYITIITLIAVIVSVVLSLVNGDAAWILSVTAAVIIVLDNLFNTYQNYISKKIKYDMKNSLTYSAKVIRDGVEQTINSDELVVGDIIMLQAGDLIPADARLIEAINLRCDEFALTHESVDAEKDALDIAEDIAPPSERKNMVFEGCCVTHGTAKAVITDIGKNTEMAKLKKIKKVSKNSENAFNTVTRFINKYSLIISSIAAFIAFVLVIIFNLQSEIGFANLVADSFLNAIASVIAVVPETLPASIAIILWFAVKKQFSLGNSLRKTSTLEKIAGISIICADKTGVLTPDEMAVAKIFNGKSICDLSEAEPDNSDLAVVKMAMICGNGINYEDSSFEAARDSGDKAIEKFCIKNENISFADSLNIFPMEASVPFDNDRKIITSINMIGGKHYVISKGSPEELLKICDNVNVENALKISQDIASDGLRVIAVATKEIEDVPAIPNANELEYGLNFLGFIGLADTPDSETIHTLEECSRLGIRTVMITGDNVITAKAIARRLGIFPDSMQAITGAQIQNMNDEELMAAVNDYSVFARVSPDDKYRIIKALKRNNETVAVTGFKNSDAPVLRKADIGFVKNSSSSDVVMNAADIVVEDIKINNLLKIIKSALNVFYNVKKTIHYFLSCNLGELLAVFIGVIWFNKNIFIAAQLLLINLLTDLLPAFSMSLAPIGDRSVNNRLQDHKKLFSFPSLITIGIQAICLCTVTLIGYGYGNSVSAACGQTVAVCVLGFSQILHVLPNFSDKLMINNKISDYITVLCGAVISIVLMLICLLTPIRTVFGFVELSSAAWEYAITLSLIFILIDILIKIGLSIYRKVISK